MLLFWAMVWTAIIVGAEIDIFVPSFPEIQENFSLTPFHVEFVLTLNLVAYGAASFWAGEWGDRYGHKRVVVWGVIMFVVGSAICWLSPSLYWLLLGRVIQGVGIAAPAVLGYVWMMDVYPKERHVSINGLMNGVVTMAVSGAPILGSFITLYWGWRANFAVLLGSGIVAWFLCQICEAPQPNRYQETSDVSYGDIFRHKFIVYSMAFITFTALLYYVFVGIAPVLYREGLGVTLSDFGWYQGAVCFSFALFSLFSGIMVDKWGAQRCMSVSILCLVFFTVILAFFVLFDVNSPLWITLNMCVYAAACAVPVAVLFPLGLNAIPEAKGKVSALQMTGRLILMALGLQIAGYVYNGNFAGIGVLLLIVMLTAFFFLKKLYKQCDLGFVLKEVQASG